MNNNSSFYDTCWKHWEGMKPIGATARHTRRIIKKLMKGLTLSNVLDVGCGDGLLLSQVYQSYPNVELYGVELSELAIEKARVKLPQSHISQLDISNQYLNRKFDLVLCIDVIEHIPNDVASLSNLYRMTEKYLIISVPLGPLFKNEKDYLGHVHSYNRKEIEQKISTAGFQSITSMRFGFPFYDLVRRISQTTLVEDQADTLYTEIPRRKRFMWSLLYYLYFLSIPGLGERYYALLKKR